jgi:hypothetical protein
MGCVPDENLIVENQLLEESKLESQIDPKQVEIAKEFSLILGSLMEEKNRRLELTQLMESLDSFADQVTLAAIFGKTENMGPSELQKWPTIENQMGLRKASLSLGDAIVEHTLQNMSNLKTIENSFGSYFARGASENANVSQKEALKDYFSKQGLVVHIPYEEKFNWDNYQGTITTTYDPLIRDDWNEGYLFNLSGSRVSVAARTLVPVVNDDYSFENPTLVVTYYYEGDFVISDPSTPSLPTLAPNSVILDRNYDDRSITQEDILLTNLPEMQLTDNDYIGLFGTKTKVRIYRGSNDLKVNFDGTVGSSADGQTFRYDQVDFSKGDAKDKRWKAVNIQFDPDWDMSENSQQLFLFTEHNLTVTGKAEAAAKVGYDFVAKKPTAEATTSVNVKIELKSSRFQVNTELVRRAVMNTIVGDTGHGTRLRNGIDYNVKPIGKLNYYFEHRYTNFPEL